MAEIWNLSTLCRCCHKDGQFTNLTTQIEESDTRNYTTLLQETFNVSMDVQLFDASNAICDTCIEELIIAHNFKVQLVGCEQKYHEYCQNELATQCELKEEVESLPENVSDDKDHCGFDDSETEEHTDDPVEPKLDDEKPEPADDQIDEGENEEVIETEKKTPKRPRGRSKKKKSGKEKLIPHVPYIPPQTLHPEEQEYVRDEGDKRIVTLKGIDEEICNKPKIKNNNFGAKKRQIQKVKRETFSCKKCKYNTFYYDYHVWHDMSQHRTDKKFYCDLCDKGFVSKRTVRDHLAAIHYKTIIKNVVCELCGKRFEDNGKYNYHRTLVHGNARFKCDQCSKKFKTKHGLTIHLFKYTGLPPYKCDECEKSYVKWSVLKVHKQRHHGNKVVRIICSICKELFPKIGDLLEHYKTVHQSDLPLRHKCEHCPKKFVTEALKLLHVSIHHLAIRFTCPICKVIYKQKITLHKHLQKHLLTTQKSNEKLRKCLECNRYYGDYEKHKKLHDNPLFRCEVCEKPFNRKTPLKRHMAMHGPKKFYECKLCKKQLVLGGYQKHLKRHTQGYFLKNEIKKKKDIEIDEFKSDSVGNTKQKKQLKVRSRRSRRSNIKRE